MHHLSQRTSWAWAILTGLVLLAAGSTGWAQTSRPTNSSPLQLKLSVSHPWMLHGTKQRAYLKIALKGLELKRKGKRAPLNLAIVLDRSGSMSGTKLQKAKEAAKMAVSLLRPNDIVSLVTYSSGIEVLVPATKLTDSNRSDMLRKIDAIHSSGWTALWGGVRKGVMEVKKFLDKKRVNRVILLSDGQANVGPRRPSDMAQLAQMSAKLGIAITTVGLGLGYNEDIMTQLAQHSDGNHGFAKNATDLQRIFQSELGNLIAVVAQDIEIEIACPPGVRPIRILDRKATISGRNIKLKWNQLYSQQHKFMLVEVDVDTQANRKLSAMANVTVRYNNMQSQRRGNLQQAALVRLTKKSSVVASNVNKPMMAHVTEARANEITKSAVALRDKGKIKQAQEMLNKNASWLQKMGKRYNSKKLLKFAKENKRNAKNMTGYHWNATRKGMRKSQYSRSNQTTW
ncbi:MAG: VWA domain-containing protein [Deltaproteobacteria bacterium]|nr:MAG: VWA domain-containing protein [Deltaproteobacteria bacterium]